MHPKLYPGDASREHRPRRRRRTAGRRLVRSPGSRRWVKRASASGWPTVSPAPRKVPRHPSSCPRRTLPRAGVAIASSASMAPAARGRSCGRRSGTAARTSASSRRRRTPLIADLPGAHAVLRGRRHLRPARTRSLVLLTSDADTLAAVEAALGVGADRVAATWIASSHDEAGPDGPGLVTSTSGAEMPSSARRVADDRAGQVDECEAASRRDRIGRRR